MKPFLSLIVGSLLVMSSLLTSSPQHLPLEYADTIRGAGMGNCVQGCQKHTEWRLNSTWHVEYSGFGSAHDCAWVVDNQGATSVSEGVNTNQYWFDERPTEGCDNWLTTGWPRLAGCSGDGPERTNVVSRNNCQGCG